MFFRPSLRRCCKGAAPKCVGFVLFSLLILQFVQYNLWRNFDGDHQKERIVEREVKDGAVREAAASSSLTTPQNEEGSPNLGDILFHLGRSDASREYPIVDDVCGRLTNACGTSDSTASLNSSSKATLSLVTQSSISNLHHLLDLAASTSSSSPARWTGLVSVAVFAPRAPEFDAALEIIGALRRCGVTDRVRFHLVALSSEQSTEEGGDSSSSPSFSFSSSFAAKDCRVLKESLKSRFKTYRNYVRVGSKPASHHATSPHHHVTTSLSTSVPYPVNLLRNVALENANSDHVLVIDIDMLPSPQLEKQFKVFLKEEEEKRKEAEEDDENAEDDDSQTSNEHSAKKRIAAALRRSASPKIEGRKIAYVIPAYELKADLDVAPPLLGAHDSPLSSRRGLPENKVQLLQAVAESQARPFYSEVCWKCQKYTDYERWESTLETSSIEVILTRQWADPWEPFYIAKKAQMPKYDERFKQYGFNRIQQVCELHIAGFEFQILNNPFLLHVGFKDKNRFHAEKQKENDRNRVIFRKFKEELKRKYPDVRRRCY